jgi:hypothetical protein
MAVKPEPVMQIAASVLRTMQLELSKFYMWKITEDEQGFSTIARNPSTLEDLRMEMPKSDHCQKGI